MAPGRTQSATQECHLWVLPQEKDQVEQLCEEGRGLLCKEERLRHQAMHNPQSARRFLLGRCLLRMGLAQHLGVRPEELRFNRQTKGKPVLWHPDVEGLCFNLSHSDEETVLAIARCCALGVDLEALSRGASAMRIAERFFPLAERQQILSRPEGRESAALKLWVLKESVTKAVGQSVWDALTSVCLDTSGPSLDWLLPPPAGSGESWALMVGPFRERYVLALALRAAGGWSGKTIRFRNHVLGQGEAKSLLFSPEMKTVYPTTRQAAL
jgi:4'-phosphopantetheinyl transferase